MPAKPQPKSKPAELSTEVEQLSAQAVDDSPQAVWFGCVVPKRHAKRAVTRNLIKRQIRAVVTARAGVLPPGLWLVRLRTPFAKEQFVSAASDALREAARSELQQLFARAVQPAAPRRPA